jgi:hypothetical protein
MNHGTTAGTIRRIAILGNHLPRQCGIATFTTDLSGAIAAEVANGDCFVVAMNDAGKHYAYPPRVVSRWPRVISRRTASQRIF